jgi:hypothetical protein
MVCAYSNLLYAHSKYSVSNNSMNSLFLWVNSFADSQFWTFLVALAISWRRQLLLYAHSKCVELLNVFGGAALFYHVGN